KTSIFSHPVYLFLREFSLQDFRGGSTITPDKKFGLTVKDLCRPGTVVTFKPNQKKPEYDDLVALYQGKELFRYRRF
ncbi:hypothetical protein ACP0F4_09760, partial [Escherichia coli]